MDVPGQEPEVLHLSDTHMGCLEFKEDQFKAVPEWVMADPNRYVIITGDLINNGLKNSVSDVYEEIIPPGKQPDKAAELLAPMASRIVAMTSGNHEHRTKKDADIDPTDIIALKILEKTGIKVPVLHDGGFVQVRWGERPNGKPWSEEIYATHGSGRGDAKAMLERIGRMVVARVNIAGHKHQELSFTDSILTLDRRNQKEVFFKRLFMCAPGFMGWGRYAKRALYKPTATGAPTLTFTSDNRIYASIGGKVC